MRLDTGLETRPPRLELVALMDVIFLLLASFVYATFTMTPVRDLDVELPHGLGAQTDEVVILVTIHRDGSLDLDGEPIGPDAVAPAILDLDPERQKSVVLRGDARAALGTAVELLSSLGAAGISKVSFQVEEQR